MPAPLAEALVAGGLPALEVTLRTPAALDAIRAMAEVPGGVVGAGTLLTPEDVRAAKAAGARFGVSPGATPRLIDACIAKRPAAPARRRHRHRGHGAFRAGLRHAEVLPGRSRGRRGRRSRPSARRSRRSPSAPRAASRRTTRRTICRLPNVICAGGSWVAPKDKRVAAGIGPGSRRWRGQRRHCAPTDTRLVPAGRSDQAAAGPSRAAKRRGA